MKKYLRLLFLFSLTLITSCGIFNGDKNTDGGGDGGGGGSDPLPSYYVVTWKNIDNSVLEIDYDVLEGDMPSYDGDTPTYNDPDGDKEYTFKGWDKEFLPVKSDITYTAQYDVISYRGVQDGYEYHLNEDKEGKEAPSMEVMLDPNNVKTTIEIPEKINGYDVKNVLIGQPYGEKDKVVEEVIIHAKVNELIINNCAKLRKVTFDYCPVNLIDVSGSPQLTYNEYQNGLYLGNDTHPYLACIGATFCNDENKIFTLHDDAELLMWHHRNYFDSWLTFNELHIGSKLRVITYDNITYGEQFDYFPDFNMKNYVVSEDNPYLCSIDGVIYTKDLSEALYYPNQKVGEYIMPEGVKRVGSFFASLASEITKITFPETLESVGYSAFRRCYKVKSLYFPDSVTSIDSFGFVEGLNVVRIGPNVKFVTDLNGVPVIINNSSLDISAYVDISHSETRFPSKIIKDGEDSGIYSKGGYQCIDYESSYGTNYTLIIGKAGEDKVFDLSLEEFTGIVYFKKYAFAGDDSIEEVIDNLGRNGGNLEKIFYHCDNLKKYVANSYYAEITGIRSLETLVINGVERIKFGENSSLKNITVTEDDNWYGYDNALIDKKSHTLVIGSNSTKRFASDVKIIGEYAFAYLNDMESIEIPASIEKVDYCAFYGCKKLREVKVSSEYIDGGAFDDCIGLTEISLLDGVKACFDALTNCTNLKKINFNDGLERFYEDISTLPHLETRKKDGISYVGDEKHPYFAAYGIENVDAEELVIADGCRIIIGSNSYIDLANSSVKTLSLPSSLYTIERNAFYRFSGLENIVYRGGNNVAYIGDSSFFGCSSLRHFEVSNSIIDIEHAAIGGTYLEYNEYEYGEYIGNDENPYLVLVEYHHDADELEIHDQCRIVMDNYYISVGMFVASHRSFEATCKHLNIPDSVTRFNAMIVETGSNTIGFISCEEVTFGKNLEVFASSIGAGKVTLKSTKLHDVKVDDVKELIIEDGVKYIPDCFIEHHKCSEIYVPDSVEYIGKRAFAGDMLMKLRIGSGLKEVGDGAFGNVYELINESSFVYINKQYEEDPLYQGPGFDDESILFFAHSVCDSVSASKISFKDHCYVYGGDTLLRMISYGETFEIPDYIKTISYYAIQNIDDVKTLIIPVSVKSIVMDYNESIIEIIYRGTIAQWEYFAEGFDVGSLYSLKVIHCTDGDINL